MKFENKFQLGMVRNSFIWNNYSLPKIGYVHWLCIKTLKTTNCGTNNWFFKTKKLNTKINKLTTTNLNVLHFFHKGHQSNVAFKILKYGLLDGLLNLFNITCYTGIQDIFCDND